MPADNPHPDIVHLPQMECPYCEASVTAAGTGDGKPVTHVEPGAVLVCIHCQEPGIYVPHPHRPHIRRATPLELAEYAVDLPLIAVQLAGFWAAQRQR
jgi:hypothetical protein